MLEDFLHYFDIRPHYDLQIMKKDQSLFDITTQGLKKIEEVFLNEKPDLVIIQGDTTTAFVASLASYYHKIPIAHVEAGLRTHNKFNPFPEEVNRRLIDHLSDLMFAPTEDAKKNLIREGLNEGNIYVTGNTVVDALHMVSDKLDKAEIARRIERSFRKEYEISFKNRTTLLVTSHRRENFGKDLHNICLALKDIAKFIADVQILYPVHLNPNVQAQVRRVLSGTKNIYLLQPLGYLTFVWLMKKAYLILTDSGGIQEEAPSLKTPVFVLRNFTERPEGIRSGVAKLVGTERVKIVSAVEHILARQEIYNKMVSAVNPYGDGKASERIVKIIKRRL
jgi:UDP-N-acetylglucosamine 2-epimerase (non-hydrolysing)